MTKRFERENEGEWQLFSDEDAAAIAGDEWCEDCCSYEHPGHDCPAADAIIELPRYNSRTTGKLSRVSDRPGCTCGRFCCRHCGRCHTPGCRCCRVLCADAQQKLMQRDMTPPDEPPAINEQQVPVVSAKRQRRWRLW